ncbi:MAG TPA: rubredoxin [Gammaproteobacteria bacterium]|nr:rubredoxin [Gammaproteobacteria bacterium]
MNPLQAANRIHDHTRLECRICWYVYDPAQGDEVEQVPPGTPFTALPAHWRCPQCDAEADKFLPLEEG